MAGIEPTENIQFVHNNKPINPLDHDNVDSNILCQILKTGRMMDKYNIIMHYNAELCI
jgi:hypothetical protein